MARSMWRGAIQFGLVTIPVKLYLATEQGGIGFNMLHKTCLNRIQMKIWCPYHEEVIPRSETVRGYEWSKDKYVVVTDEDLESVPLKTVRAIEIEKFVDEEQAEETASRFVKQAYYLEPDEIRSLEELNLPEQEIEIKPTERKMAEQLVESMTGEFDATEYKDDYREALMGVIEAKVAGEEPTRAAKAEPTKIGDLMAALEASVAAAREGRRTGGEAKAAGSAPSAGRAKRSAGVTAKGARGARAGKGEAAEEKPARRRKTA